MMSDKTASDRKTRSADSELATLYKSARRSPSHGGGIRKGERLDARAGHTRMKRCTVRGKACSLVLYQVIPGRIRRLSDWACNRFRTFHLDDRAAAGACARQSTLLICGNLADVPLDRAQHISLGVAAASLIEICQMRQLQDILCRVFRAAETVEISTILH